MPRESRTPAVAVAEVRRAVRTALAALPALARAAPVVVACSGGADSLALAAAVVAARQRDCTKRQSRRRDVHHTAPRCAPLGGGVVGVVVDHGLQDGSDAVARAAAEQLAGLGIEAVVHRVEVSGGGGGEAAARRARYAALTAARPHPESAVLLGHTLDDQAETVLLGLGRGSGPRSIAGMRAWDVPWCRPLLGVRRETTRAACAALGLTVWDDPHNADSRFTRVRLRHEVLPLLEDVLAGGVAAALARTATQLREDGDVLDALAAGLLESTRGGSAPDARGGSAPDDRELDVGPLAGAPAALRRRVLRAWLREHGVPAVTDAHLRRADRLIERAGSAGDPAASVALPGGLELIGAHGRLLLRPVAWPE